MPRESAVPALRTWQDLGGPWEMPPPPLPPHPRVAGRGSGLAGRDPRGQRLEPERGGGGSVWEDVFFWGGGGSSGGDVVPGVCVVSPPPPSPRWLFFHAQGSTFLPGGSGSSVAACPSSPPAIRGCGFSSSPGGCRVCVYVDFFFIFFFFFGRRAGGIYKLFLLPKRLQLDGVGSKAFFFFFPREEQPLPGDR